MKYLFFFILCLLSILPFHPKTALAHGAENQSFFLINGKYSDVYPVYVTSLKNFTLPLDKAPENYLINTLITFEIDQKLLPFPPDVIPKITYAWDLGDGNTAAGTKIVHSYSRIGTYLLTIHADYGGYSSDDTKPTLQTILINILPNSSYKLPQAIITVNNKQISDPTKNPITLSFPKVMFDGRQAKPGSAQIVSYFWDLGDGSSSTKPSLTHVYSQKDQLYIFPMLRVKDANGFISDTYVQLEKPSSTSNSAKNIHPLLLPGILFLNVLFIGGILILLKKR